MINSCTIIKELQKGGQKTVHLASHPKEGLVVIKEGVISSFTSLERIRREVELLSTLESEYYPRQLDFQISLKSKEFLIIEEYIQGKTLRDSMNNFQQPKEVLSLIYEISKGLSIIWEKNIVHRDLKPENIMIREDGRPCIIDLGIAKFIDLESLTQTIAPIGPCTFNYAAPEQLRNLKNLIDPRTDFFSLGLIALELVLGIHPFDPIHSKNDYSIPENILTNNYGTEYLGNKASDSILAFAHRTLQTQPYERFRNYQMFINFLEKHTS